MDESLIRCRAKRSGFCVVKTRGLEHRRRTASGAGVFMLLAPGGVTALGAATLTDIAEFLEAHERAQWRRLH
jgi:hypothetical protein